MGAVAADDAVDVASTFLRLDGLALIDGCARAPDGWHVSPRRPPPAPEVALVLALVPAPVPEPWVPAAAALSSPDGEEAMPLLSAPREAGLAAGSEEEDEDDDEDDEDEDAVADAAAISLSSTTTGALHGCTKKDAILSDARIYCKAKHDCDASRTCTTRRESIPDCRRHGCRSLSYCWHTNVTATCYQYVYQVFKRRTD